MKRFQKITTEHLGAPFGAGYGDQGKYSLAEFIAGSVTNAPAGGALPVNVTVPVEGLPPTTLGGATATDESAAGVVVSRAVLVTPA